MQTRAIIYEDYELILEQDRRVYPTDKQVSKEIIAMWYKNNPELGIIFEEEGKVVGDCIIIPLNKKGWEKLILGDLAESEVSKYIFDNLRDKEIGLHIYHIEKIDKNIKEFYKIALKSLRGVVDRLIEKNSELKVIGFSGLAVSGEGIGLFEKKLNCKERDYICQEHIFEKDRKKIVLEKTSKPGYDFVNRCKMLVLYPKDKSVVWDYLNENYNTTDAEKAILKKSEEPEGKAVKGYDFNQGLDWDKIIDSFETTGFQATHLSKAIEIIKKMRKEKAFIYLGYTSNMVSSGIRDIIRYLVEHKLVDVLVTTGGGIEEDFIKCLDDFKLGAFSLSGEMLRGKGINRIGNILVPNSRYLKFEDWVLPILEKYKDKILKPSELIHILGKEIDNKNSIYYWAYKNNIPVYSHAIMDGSLGDMIYFFKSKNPNFKIEVSDDTVDLNNSNLGKKKTGMIILGSGVIKHSICNANLYRDGADYAVFFNNSSEWDGSDAGARPDEAVSWGKIRVKGESIKVFGDITINFPIVVGKAFAREIRN